jgi:PhnB protein
MPKHAPAVQQTPKHIPAGYSTLTTALVFKDAKKAIAFYKKAFGAQERIVLDGPDGTVLHAELKIGDSVFMLGEENPAWPEHKAAESTGNAGCFSLNLYVPDADAAFKQAVAAGAAAVEPPKDAFWGDRYGRVVDPFGYTWGLLTHVKDVPPEQMKKAALDFADKALAGKD